MSTVTNWPRLYGRTNAARAEADRLAAKGHHVHYAADGETRCHTGHCARAAKEPQR
ncbi:hypothetical protein ABTZ57_16020 [Streptomyces sp. NPDC094048]|uniref:hypothetical protein n=1 Tax=Streptomyces sp. NPDC094048 TaxID=3155207 RepID=UPI003323DCA7